MSLTAPHHPGGKGRVIALDAPYVLPEGMDLRGIAGVVLKRQQNPEILRALDEMPEDDFAALHKHSGVFDGNMLRQDRASGPHAPAPFNLPAPIMEELETLSSAFLRLTGAKQNSIMFPATRASQQFHIDGANARPAWRLTYAFTGAQTVWHNAVRDNDMPVIPKDFVGFPVLPDEKTGAEGADYFAADGALMFLTYSPNGLFHKAPDDDGKRRFITTLTTNAPKREGCTLSCPFPCR